MSDEESAKLAGTIIASALKVTRACVTVADLAALLRIGGCEIDEEELLNVMHNEGWLARVGNAPHVPTARAEATDYLRLESEAVGVDPATGAWEVERTLLVTPDGAAYFVRAILGGRQWKR